MFVIEGRLICKGGLFIKVQKLIERNNRNQVRTFRYSYHAGLEGDADRSIFRYDNAHTYVREGHADEHHKHRFDYATWGEIAPPQWVGVHNWPTLTDVIEELYEWWQENGQFLASIMDDDKRENVG